MSSLLELLCFNTSYVSVQAISACNANDIYSRFQYIICVGSSTSFAKYCEL